MDNNQKLHPEELVDAPVEELVEEPVEELVDAPVEELVEEPVEELVEELVEEPVEELVEEPVEEPVEELVEEPVEEPVEELVEEPATEVEPCAVAVCPACQGKKLCVKGLVKRSISLALSIMMLVFAFLPVFSINVEIGANEYSAGFSAIDSIVLWADSAHSLGEKDLTNTYLNNELSGISQKITNYTKAFGSYEAMEKEYRAEFSALLSQYVYNATRLSFHSSQSPFRWSIIALAVVCVIYVLVSLAYFVISALDFALFMFGKKQKNLRLASISLLCAIPALVITVFGAFCTVIRAEGLTCSESITATALITALSALAFIAYLAIDRIFLCGEIKVCKKTLVKRLVSTVAAVVMLIAIFVPVANLTVRTTFLGHGSSATYTTALDGSFFTRFDLSPIGLNSFKNITASEAVKGVDNSFTLHSGSSVIEFVAGNADGANGELARYALLGFGGWYMDYAMVLLPIIMIVVALMAAAVIWQNLYAIVTGVTPRKAITLPIRIVGIVLATVALAITVVFLLIANNNLVKIPLYNGAALFSMGAGTIVALVGAIGAMATPMGEKK